MLFSVNTSKKSSYKSIHLRINYFYILKLFLYFIILKMECPICFGVYYSIFSNSCGHTWCKQCHQKLIHFNHTSCPLCRETIVLQKQLPTNKYIEWLINGGEPMYVWRTKKHRKKYKQYLKYKYT